MKLLLTLFLLTCTLSALAGTFTVTTNADSGPGSLRDAITQANANGTATPDIIDFNIADQSFTGRTITLASALPALTGNLVIDGTTQPGTVLGISAARIIITNTSAFHGNYFVMIGVTNVQIFGLLLRGLNANYGFYFREAGNLTFGAAGKGNVLQGFSTAIECDQSSATDAGSTDITIQGNILGTSESGVSIFSSIYCINGDDLDFVNVANLQIGGLKPGEGNLLNEGGYPMSYTATRDDDFGYFNYQGNTEGTDVTGTIRLSPTSNGCLFNGYAIDGQGTYTGVTRLSINITDNVSAGGYQLTYIANRFIIQGNHIGVAADNTTNILNGSISVASSNIVIGVCNFGLIGGPNPTDKNYIANNTFGSGIDVSWSDAITISQNSIFCNTIGINLGVTVYNHVAPYVNITQLTPTTVGGTALPNDTIEVFYDDECPGCEGKTYIGNTFSDNNGNWSFPLPAPGDVVATATDVNGFTSAFSTAVIKADNDSIVLQNPTCGHNNGFIKNLHVISGTQWYWKDAAGNIVGHNIDLTGVGPGTYTFFAFIGSASCAATSAPYTLVNVDLPAFDSTAVSITQPGCGQNNGSLFYSGTFDPGTTYSWLEAGTTVSPDFSAADPLTKLGPGSYMLRLTLKGDSGCHAQYGPFALINHTGASLNTSNAQITNTTCSQFNGAITGITFQNATPPVYVAWRDETGATVGNSIDLAHMPAGNYRLVFKDSGTCDSIFTNWYTIPDEGTITFDTSQMTITVASCKTPNGTITGIAAANATIFNWVNTGTGNPAGATLDISGLASGIYQLTMSNAYGCQAQTPDLTVGQMPAPAFDYTRLQVGNDTCNSGIGAIRELTMIDGGRTYTWNWYNSEGATIGTTAGFIDGLKSGGYTATVTDEYGCTVTSNVITLTNVDLNPPLPQVADQYIPRNTSTIIPVANPLEGWYKLFDGPPPGSTVLDSSSMGILHTPSIPQDETLYVEFTRGDCMSPFAPVNIKVFDSVKIFVPNAFTPNGDGVNDRWHIIVNGLTKKIQISVFDRWGTPVFNSEDPNVYWDGTSGSRPLSGIFVYMITGTDYYGNTFQAKGTLTIMR